MNAELAEGCALQFPIGRMIFDPLHVAPELVALMQHRHVAVGEPRAFVEMTACERAKTVEMRLDMAEQIVGQMDAQQIGQRRIGAIEVHSRSYRARAIPTWPALAVASCLGSWCIVVSCSFPP